MKSICNLQNLSIKAISELGERGAVSPLSQDENLYELVFMSAKCKEGEAPVCSIRHQRYKKSSLLSKEDTNYKCRIGIIFSCDSALPNQTILQSYDGNTEFKSLFTKALRIWRKKEAGYINLCNCIFYKILYLIEKYAEGSHPSYLKRIKPAVDYIHSNYTHDFPYAELASMCKMSDSYFRRLFFKCFKCSASSYIKKLRVEHACKLLSSEQAPSISEVSRASGYDNIFYFSRVFKEATGVSPSKYTAADNSAHTNA